MLHELNAFQGNLKDLSEENYERFKNELFELGFSSPFHFWVNPEDNKKYILDGHQRHRVLTKLKEEGVSIPAKLPAIQVFADSFKQAKKKVLALTSAFGKMSDQGLYEFMSDAELSIDEIKTSFNFADIDMVKFEDEFFKDINVEILDSEKEDDVPEVTHDPVTKKGDIWILGNHRVMCGDSTMIDDVEKLMKGEKADMVFTDPPYNIASDSKNYASDVSKSMNDLKNSEWDKNFDIKTQLINLINSTKESSTFYVWTSHFLIQNIWDILGEFCNFTGYLVWNKPNPMPSLSKRHPTWNSELCAYGTRGSKRVVNFPSEGHFTSVRTVIKKSDGSHPTQKPQELIIPIIEFSSGKNQLILDGFLGSGSTLIACEKTNRKCYGMEIDEHYCDVIVERWQQFTGKEASLESTGQTYSEIKKAQGK
jgi:site-specific DNA-methyltransferase (adenine-specific)